MKLTSDQIEIVRSVIDTSGIKIDTLKDDLLDHLCCVIESEMSRNPKKEFNQLLNEALSDLAPDGLQQIERETVFLLNSKRILFMKKVMYLVGFIGALALTGGVTFKLLHLPGADQLFLIGFFVLFLIFVPLQAIGRYKAILAKAMSEKLKLLLGVIAALAASAAGIFKLMHLPGADQLLIIGAAVFAFGFLPFFFFTMYRKSIS
jgi:ABC-type multidrug transport system fused ATPase/permease subunit